MSIREKYRTAVLRDGDVFAAIAYLLAAVSLMISAMDLHRVFDTFAGTLWFSCDLFIIILKMMEYSSSFRALILFSGSLLGGASFFQGALGSFSPSMSGLHFFEWGAHLVAAVLILMAGLSGFLVSVQDYFGKNILSGKIKGILSGYIGRTYMVAYIMASVFSLIQFSLVPSMSTGGYVLASFLWIWASDCIRRKFRG